MPIVLTLVLWFTVSCVFGVLTGRMIRFADQAQPGITAPTLDTDDHDDDWPTAHHTG